MNKNKHKRFNYNKKEIKSNGNYQGTQEASNVINRKEKELKLWLDQNYLDSMYNVASGLNVAGQSKTIESQFLMAERKMDVWWQNLYLSNGSVKRIIDTIANEMTREWVKILGDDIEDNLQKYLEKLDTKTCFADLVRWSSLMGGCIIVMVIDDGGTLSDPVDYENIHSIQQLRIIDKSQVFLLPDNYYSSPTDAKFNEVKYYTIRPFFNGVQQDHPMYDVHEERVLKLDGEPVTPFMRKYNNNWASPILQSYYSDVVNLEQAYAYASELMHELAIGVFSIKDLGNTLKNPNGDALVKARLNNINLLKSSINSIVIDSDLESFQKVTTSVPQIEELLNAFEAKVCAMSGIPRSILFGDKRSGIVNGENADVRMWYDNVKNKQQRILQPLLMKLLRYIALAKDCEFKGKIEDVGVDFISLWQYEEKDLVDMMLKVSQMDASNIDRGVYSSEEVRERFIGQKFNFDLKLEIEEQGNKQEDIEEIEKSNEDIKIEDKFKG